jgi:hypothetical protein
VVSVAPVGVAYPSNKGTFQALSDVSLQPQVLLMDAPFGHCTRSPAPSSTCT